MQKIDIKSDLTKDNFN